MRLGILGEHPVLKPGFASAMALNQIAAFSKNGAQVTLYLPATEFDTFDARMEKTGHASLDDLDRFGFDFDIVPIDRADQFGSDLDVLIWQSYERQHEVLWPRRREFAVTKSFPRFAASTSAHFRRKGIGHLKKFDALGFALTVDVELMQTMFPGETNKFAHVPRGFSPKWLRMPKPEHPSIACDAAVKAPDGGRAAVAHMLALFNVLRERGDAFSILATRQAARILGADTHIPGMPMLDFYKRFIGPSWVYMPCDFQHSVHNNNVYQDDQGNKVFVGLYENQIVEAQMAGSIPIYQRGHIDPEIVFDPEICALDDYADTDALVERWDAIIENHAALSQRARDFAEQKHSTDAMYRAWSALLHKATGIV